MPMSKLFSLQASPRTSPSNNDAQTQRNIYGNQPNPGAAQNVSIFDSLNNRLLNFGIPRWNLGSLVVEPIYSVGTLLMMLMFGLPGILLIVILFVVSQLSRGFNFGQMYNGLFGGGGQQNPHQNVRSSGASSNRQNFSPSTASDSNKPKYNDNFGGPGRRLGD